MMRKVKLLLLLFVLAAGVETAASAPVDEVTLVVAADGASKDEATTRALRSAVEQAYGAFVSSSTTILNDALVSEEIATIATGSVKEYQEIACAALPDGRYYVTLRATVCVAELMSYTQRHDAVSTTFDGVALDANMALMELNKANEQAVFDHLWDVIRMVYPHTFNYSLSITEPTYHTLSTSDLLPTAYHYSIDATPREMEYYELTCSVKVVFTAAASDLESYICQTLDAIKLSQEEESEYQQRNVPVYPLARWCQAFLDYSLYKGLPRNGAARKDTRAADDAVGALIQRFGAAKEKAAKKKSSKGAGAEQGDLSAFILSPAALRSELPFTEDDKAFFAQARRRFNILDNNHRVVAIGARVPQKGEEFTFSIKIPKDIITEFTGFELVRTDTDVTLWSD